VSLSGAIVLGFYLAETAKVQRPVRRVFRPRLGRRLETALAACYALPSGANRGGCNIV